MRLCTAAALAAALLAGCAVKTVPTPRPALPVPERFPNAGDAAAAVPAAPDIPWQTFFADAGLRQLIETALQNNRDLRIAVLNIEQARTQLQLRDADRWPTVNAGIGAVRQPTASGGIASLYSAGLQVTAYEADLFGRVRSLSDAAAAQVLSSAEARKAVQISLVGGVANAWLALRADDELLRMTRDTLASREDSLRLTQLRLDNGAASQLELRAAQTAREAARVVLAQQQRQRLLDENALALLLGQSVPTTVLGEGTSPAVPELPAGLPSEVLTRRPDVRQAELQLAVADANITAARAAFFPKITLTGSIGTASGALDGLFKGGSYAWSFAPQLLQPIFDAGRNRAALRSAEVGRDIAVAQYERAVQTAFREVADALAGRATLSDQLQAQTAQQQAEQDRYALTELRFRKGASSYLEVLDAQRSLFAAQQSRVQTQLQATQNLVTLYRVLGGGWSAEPAR